MGTICNISIPSLKGEIWGARPCDRARCILSFPGGTPTPTDSVNKFLVSMKLQGAHRFKIVVTKDFAAESSFQTGYGDSSANAV